jgi:hypothetical protein
MEALIEILAQIFFTGWELAIDLACDRYGWRGFLAVTIGPLAAIGLLFAIFLS